MTTEERQLLLKDLCARLPYGVICLVEFSDDRKYAAKLTSVSVTSLGFGSSGVAYLHCCKPYLRPMSSMTDEEEILFRCELPTKAKTDAQLVAMRMELFLKGHLDYNHLIEKGLALEAPEGMYKEE